jgi:hypothetical protein
MAPERAKRGCAMSIARLWVVGALVAALMALVPGVASAAGVTSSVGTLAGDALGQSSASSGDEDDDGGDDGDDDDGDDDDGDDDDGGGGGGLQDRAYCEPPGSPEFGQCRYVTSGGAFFDFDATSGPLGENPTGSGVDGSFVGFAYDVTCLQVMGNQASIGGRITSPPDLAGEGYVITVRDNAPASDQALPALLGVAPPPNTPNCGQPFLLPFFLVEGDIVVQDNVGAGGDDEDDGDDGDDDGDDGDD